MIRCEICKQEWDNLIPWSHLKRLHSLTIAEYRDKYGPVVSPEYSARLSANSTEMNARPDIKAAKAKAATEMWKDPDHKQEIHDLQIVAQNRPEVKALRSESIKQSWQDPQVRKERLENQKVACSTDEHRAKMSGISKEVNSRPEVKAAIGESTRKAWADQDKRDIRIENMRASMSTPEALERQREIGKQTMADPALRQMKSEQFKKANQDPAFLAAMADGLAKASSLSGPHRQVKEVLVNAGQLQFKSEQWIAKGIRCDEVDWDSKLAIEVNGCYWHCCPACHPDRKPLQDPRVQQNLANDKKKEDFLKANGWTLLTIWEHDNPSKVLQMLEVLNIEILHGPEASAAAT